MNITSQIKSNFRHLIPAMSLRGSQGMCIHRSVALVLDVPRSELVFGVFNNFATPEEAAEIIANGQLPSREPFVHAWMEHQGVVFAPTTIERMNGELIPQHRRGYYDINKATRIKRLGRGVVQALVQQYDFLPVLRGERLPHNGVSFGTVFLDAANVKWKASADGGVIPA